VTKLFVILKKLLYLYKK